MSESFLNGRVTLHVGDCLNVLDTLAENSIDSVCCDPPYHLTSIVKWFGGKGAAAAQHGTDGLYARASAGFMGKQWDGGDVAFRPETWAAVMRVMKPGAHLVAFGGSRGYHRMACAIEDAGFEIRDSLMWVYASGFPKSHSVPVAIDKAAGVAPRGKAFNMKGRGDRAEELDANGREFLPLYTPVTPQAAEWEGWGTALKPAFEPIVLARKPLSEGTVAANVLRWATGALNIDGCRVGTSKNVPASESRSDGTDGCYGRGIGPGSSSGTGFNPNIGRWPANIAHDGSTEVVAAFPAQAGAGGPASGPSLRSNNTSVARGKFNGLADGVEPAFHADSGSAARFFFTAKADAHDRVGSKHPTVKPVDLMQWLVRLVTPPGGTVLDCFAGTGTSGEAAFREGFNAVLIEREPEYQADIRRRMALCLAGPDERKRESIKARGIAALDAGPLFGATS